MKLTIISDTHLRHEELGTLSGDVLIHCGDMFDLFDETWIGLEQMDEWFSRQRFDLILCIGGNHDRPLEAAMLSMDRPFEHAVYLEDEALVHDGVTFYGSPWTPLLDGHAFFADDEILRQRWFDIPRDTDILITHTPPAGILDLSSRGAAYGCNRLAKRVREIKPAIHCFGHVHASGGTMTKHEITFVNASSVDRPGGPLRTPVTIELPGERAC